MKLWKRFLSAASACALSVSMLSLPVNAQMTEDVFTAGGYSAAEIKLMKKIKSMIENYSTDYLDISDYNLSYTEFEELYGSVVLNEPSLFYVSTVSAYLEYDTKDHILAFSPIYRYSKNRVRTMQEQIDEYVDGLMSGVEDEWSDAEKVLYVHDYIAKNAQYYNGDNSYKGRNIYDVFVRGSSVCVGYSLGFQYIMDMMDIPCICITSDTHIWNMVEIDSNWYHVDITWDDMEFGNSDVVLHTMNLLSEYCLDVSDPPHEPYDYAMIADSSKYDDYFWRDSASPVEYYNGYWYYTTKEGLCRYSFNTDKSELVYKIGKSWKINNDKEWIISFGKVIKRNGSIYFNSPNNIYRYDVSGNKTYHVSEPKLKKGYQIYNISIDNNTLNIYSSDDFTVMEKEVTTVNLSDTASKSDKSGFSVTRDKSTVTLEWDGTDNAEQYVIYRYNKGTKKIHKIYTTTKTSVTFKKSQNEDDYLYAFKIRTSKGLSGYSSWK